MLKLLKNKHTIEDHEEKQTKALESLNFSNKTSKLKKVEDVFLNNYLTNLIKDRLNKMMEVQNAFEVNDLNYSSTKQNYNLNNFSLPAVFLRDIFERRL